MNSKSITPVTNAPSSMQNEVFNEMSIIVSNAFNESEKASKELYNEKSKLIISAKDMSTAEKLTALNECLFSHCRFWNHCMRLCCNTCNCKIYAENACGITTKQVLYI